MTFDRLLVLLLSLSFLLLAPPAAADMAVQHPAPMILAEQKGPDQTPEPARPDDTGLFLLSLAPEAPPPTSTDEAGGHDGLTLPALFRLPRLASAGMQKMPAGLSGTGQACAHPWPTGPPRA